MSKTDCVETAQAAHVPQGLECRADDDRALSASCAACVLQNPIDPADGDRLALLDVATVFYLNKVMPGEGRKAAEKGSAIALKADSGNGEIGFKKQPSRCKRLLIECFAARLPTRLISSLDSSQRS